MWSRTRILGIGAAVAVSFAVLGVSVFFGLERTFTHINNYDIYFDGGKGTSSVNDLLGNAGKVLGVSDNDTIGNRPNFNAFIIQEASGPGGTVINNDRFYIVGYEQTIWFRTETFDMILFSDLAGASMNANLYFFFELTGSVQVAQASDFAEVYSYTFDGGTISFIVDDEGTVNRALDGASLADLRRALEAKLSAKTYDSPTGGDPFVSPVPTGDAELPAVPRPDAAYIELLTMRPHNTPGRVEATGSISVEHNPLVGTTTIGYFRADLAVVGHNADNVFFTNDDRDMSDFVAPDPNHTNLFVEVLTSIVGEDPATTQTFTGGNGQSFILQDFSSDSVTYFYKTRWRRPYRLPFVRRP